MKLKIEIEVDTLIRDPARHIAYMLRQLEADLLAGKGDIADGIRLGMRARQRLFGPEQNTIGFADIED